MTSVAILVPQRTKTWLCPFATFREIKVATRYSPFYAFPAQPSAISGGAGLEHASGSVTPLRKICNSRTGGRAVSVENLRVREAAPTSVNVTVGKRSREYLTDR